jgi:hypothetical protein
MWGALLRGLTYVPAIGKGAVNFVKRHKYKTAITGLAGLGIYSLLSPDDNPDEEDKQQTTTDQSSQQQTPKQQSGQKQTSTKQGIDKKPAQQGGVKVESKPSNINTSEDSDKGSLSQIANQLQSLFLDLDQHRQLYEVLSQQYLQANEIYEKQLLQTMQVVPLLLAKTPLNSMTNEDLIQHMNQLFTTMPYTEALERVGHITKGYYLAKANGVDPSSLSTTDLVMIAENPVLAKSVNENIVQFLEQMGEILKFKIKSNMDKVGALKDQYKNKLKELEEKGKLYKSLIDAYKFEAKLNFDMEKFNETMKHKWAELQEKQSYHNQSLALRRESLELRKQKQQQSNSKTKESKIETLFSSQNT